MRVSVLKGPLNRELLQAIARLYGSHDRKYSSVDFCDVMFNRNPSGYSFHAFAHEADRIVGHYAVIPVGIIVRGKRELSGKGEGLFLEDEYRSELVPDGNTEIPVGIALAVFLYRFVLEHGIRVIHVIADDTIGVIHRMAGCKKEEVKRQRSVFLLKAQKLDRTRQKLAQLWALRAVSLTQRVLVGLLRIVLLLSPRPLIREAQRIDAGPLSTRVLASRDNEAGEDKWTILTDPAHLAWFFETGLVGAYAEDDLPEEYVLVRKSSEPGGEVEILDCNFGENRTLRAVAFLLHVIDEASSEGATRVIVSSWLPQVTGLAIKRAARLLGFAGRAERTSFYLKSDDPFFLKTANIALTPFFYGTF